MKFSKKDKPKETVEAEDLEKIPARIAREISKVREEFEKALKEG